MFNSLKPLALAAALLLAPQGSPQAQELSVSLGGKQGALSWSANFGSGQRSRIGVSYGRNYGHGRSYGRGHQASKRIWVPGRHDRVARQVWVPGRSHREWIAPVYDTRYDDCGRRYEVIVRDGYWHERHDPGYYDKRYESVWVPGYYRTVRY